MEQDRSDLDHHDHVLLGLIMNLQASAMIQMGKLADPTTGEARRDLDAARAAIDLLKALQAKCRGNLAQEATALLDRVVMDLQLNYTDECQRDGDDGTAGTPSVADATDDAGGTSDEDDDDARS